MLKIVLLTLLLALVSCGDRNTGESDSGNFLLQQTADCVEQTDPEKLAVSSWNLKFFPTAGMTTFVYAKNVIQASGWDIVAVQEIDKPHMFEKFGDHIQGMGQVYIKDQYLSLGVLYNESLLKVITTKVLFEQDKDFIRPVLAVVFETNSGEKVKVLNVHLKAGGKPFERDQRNNAIEKLNTYVKNLDLKSDENENLILLGDFNSYFGSRDPKIETLNHATEALANGPRATASWAGSNGNGSQYDHIFMANTVHAKSSTPKNILLDRCDARVLNLVSDHRPVVVELDILE